ncbi:Polynucleotide 5'-hydroxyl-kinase NOL9, partial [Dufourea novaeangliae]
ELPQYKRTNKVIRVKRKSNPSTMDSLCLKSKTGQCTSFNASSLQNEQLDSKHNVKQRKKKSYTTAKGSSHSVDVSLESKDGSTSAKITSGKNTKQHRRISNQQRNLGSPVIIEALSKTLSSLRIPDMLRQSPKLKRTDNASDCILPYTQNNSSKMDDACIIVAESVNPNNTSCTPGNIRIATPLKKNRKPRKDKTPLRTTNNNENGSTWVPSESPTTIEQCLENVTLDTHTTDVTIPDTETEISNFQRNSTVDDQNSLRFYCLRNKVVVVMPEKTRFCFTGKILLKVIHGAVEVYGYRISTNTKPIEIYSPRGYSSVSIETSTKFSQDTEPDIWASLSVEGISRDFENKLVVDIDGIQDGTAVILLTDFKNNLTKFLDIYYPFRLFPKIKNVPYQSSTDPKRAEAILQSHLHVGNYSYKQLVVDERVTKEISETMLNRWHANEWSCTIIAGGKNVGKSTATRCLINSLLPVSKKVVLVDVDPGQTECTPAGCISYSLIEEPLMGPNFTHLKPPVFQLYIGDVNVTRCITRYIEGIKMLVDKLINCPTLSRLPIVVNTMGFTNGIGWDIAVFTIKLIQPSLVVQIMSEKSKNNYPEYLSKEVINKQEPTWAAWSVNVVNRCRPCNHELCVTHSHAERKSAPANETWNMEPYQQRELVLISYLSEIVQNPENSTSCYDALSFSMNDAVPYVTSCASLTISIPRASVSPSHGLNVLNGNIVALCGIDVEDAASNKTNTAYGPRVLNRLPLCSCYGFGIVRAVDAEQEEIYINTPLSASMMQHVNCLVGCIPVPVTLLQLNQQRNVPYTGGSDVLPTSREHRRGYFRTRYQKTQANNS